MERRSQRAVLHACEECATDRHMRVVLRTAYVLYVRCARCANLRTEPKPGVRQLGFEG
ncbi:MAG: hypothetical protein H0V80_12010 [Acidobacteria bacterium]|nr:hypothetical protein [Acidobacteriota bacterium]